MYARRECQPKVSLVGHIRPAAVVSVRIIGAAVCDVRVSELLLVPKKQVIITFGVVLVVYVPLIADPLERRFSTDIPLSFRTMFNDVTFSLRNVPSSNVRPNGLSIRLPCNCK